MAKPAPKAYPRVVLALDRRLATLLCIGLTACGAETSLDVGLDEGPLSIEGGSPEALGVLDVVNDPAITFSILDVQVGLDRRAARNIVDARPLADLAALDAVKYVGPRAIDRLVAYARAEDRIPTAHPDDALILGVVNAPDLTMHRLDITIGLDARAARNIFAFRAGPDTQLSTADDAVFVSLAELDALPYVGPSALSRLLAYAQSAPAPSPPCLIISEYLEGAGQYNKAVEVHNCGAQPIPLARYGLCLARNDDTTCAAHARFDAPELAAGAVWLACRKATGHPASTDPAAPIKQFCDQQMSSVMNFNGNDRVVLFEDLDDDGRMGAADRVVDAMGVVDQPMTAYALQDILLRRCDFRPQGIEAFDLSRFTSHSRADMRNLGLAPTESCAPPSASPGQCESNTDCTAPLRCVGRPTDGSSPFGQCVDTRAVPGEGAQCGQRQPCAEGTLCAGSTRYGEGFCVPQWMATRVVQDAWAEIADGAQVNSSVVVTGLASVPEDITVTLRLDHDRPTDLRVTLIDPNGDRAVLWERSAELDGGQARSFVTTGISRDDQVNGQWTLSIEDLQTGGGTGWLRGWDLFVVSRWD